jgi:hypothetical protein
MADRWAGFRARAPVTVVLGLSAGIWAAARIPAIKAELNLSPGILGLCLLGLRSTRCSPCRLVVLVAGGVSAQLFSAAPPDQP